MCVLLGFLQKNIGDPYYEPTIVVRDYDANDGNCTMLICKKEETSLPFLFCIFLLGWTDSRIS